jgi:phenylpyruvate tautomerase PptA (4-oxalocrotonate tautomerase family)
VTPVVPPEAAALPPPPPTEPNQQEEHMTTIKLTVPPDQTPAEEAELVATVAAALADSTGADTIQFELQKSEEVSYQAVGSRTAASARWSA